MHGQELFLKFLADILPSIIGSVVLWLIVGALAGMLLGVAGYFAGGRAGAWRFDWRHAKWIRLLAAVWLVVSLACLGGGAGGCEGAYRGVEDLLRDSDFRREELLAGGEFVASLVFALDHHLAGLEADRPTEEPDPEQERRLKNFQEGRVELNVTLFLERLEKARAEKIREASDSATEYVREKLSLPESAIIDLLVGSFTSLLLRIAAERQSKKHLKEYGLDPFTFLRGMKGVAAASGDPDTATLDELSNYVIDGAFVPMVLHPARGYVRGQQLVLGLLAVGACSIPLLLFWGLRRFAQPRPAVASAGKEETAPPPEKPSGPPSFDPGPKPE